MARFLVINGRSHQAKARTQKGRPTLEVAMDPSQAKAVIRWRYGTTEAFEGSCFQTADAGHNIDKAFDLILGWQNQ